MALSFPVWEDINLLLLSSMIIHVISYLYLNNEKSESLEMFKTFKVEVENQLTSKIKVVRSESCGEYYSRHTNVCQIPRPFANFLNLMAQ